MLRLVFLAPVLALTACVYPDDSVPAPESDVPSLGSDQSQPQLALMDHLLGTYFASDVPSRPTICAATHDGRSEVALAPEAERALMSRYDSLAPFTRCAWLEEGWQDSETGEPAMVFTVHSFSCTATDNCSGFGGYIAGQTSSMSNLYTMRYTGGAWAFDRDPRLVGEQ